MADIRGPNRQSIDQSQVTLSAFKAYDEEYMDAFYFAVTPMIKPIKNQIIPVSLPPKKTIQEMKILKKF